MKIKIRLVLCLFIIIFLFFIGSLKKPLLSIKYNSTESKENENQESSKSNIIIYNDISDINKCINEVKKENKNISINSITMLSEENIKRIPSKTNMVALKNGSIKSTNQQISNIINSTPLSLETAEVVAEYCAKLDIPISLVLALIDLESDFNQYEVGADNDRGYCQIIPSTEKWLAETYGYILDLKYDSDKIFEPQYNIGLGMLYLHILKNAYGENYHKILSEYNRGIYNLKKYYNEHGTYVTSYSRGIISREKKYLQLNN
ncbi:lytic transglycosylase domain-containing protein [Sporosalibacterium faouarense]|uniref:lytic transglycosylase domain-containing protein n=1 Tax=Sporosalibacterium faouarense TaxID=516123 RepID=UPI00192C75A3|nr:transglycosylase SLT domain-containing protein [Sporosalibacterium faouarense]